MSFEHESFKLKAHVFNKKTGNCKFCGTHHTDDAVENKPCEEATDDAPDFEYDEGEVMAYYNLSDEDWDSLSSDVQKKLAYRTHY